MANADEAASEAARLLARSRWHGTVVSRAVATVVERRDELDESQLAKLRTVTSEREGATDDD